MCSTSARCPGRRCPAEKGYLVVAERRAPAKLHNEINDGVRRLFYLNEFIAGPTARTQQFAFVAVTFVAVVFVAIAFVAVAFVAVTFVAVTFVAVTFMTIALSKYISIYTLTFTSILR
jgi:hypothetical protein